MTNNQLIAKVLFGLEPTDFYSAKDLRLAGLPFSTGAQGNGLSRVPFSDDWNYLMLAVARCEEEGFLVKISSTTLIEDEHFNILYEGREVTKIGEVFTAVKLVCKILTAVEAEYEDGDVHVCCPHCKATEQHPQDEQRHHLQNFNLWQNLGPFRSQLLCVNCNEDFVINWKIFER